MTFHIVAVASIALGILCAVAIALDEVRRPQHHMIMNFVWPLCALFAHVLLVAFYAAYGRAQPGGHHGHMPAESSMTVSTVKATCHCGSGCALGDLIAEWSVFFFPALAVTFGWHGIFDERVYAIWVLDYIAAFIFGIGFQYFTIAPMQGLGFRDGLKAALKADFLSLTAWQIGMYGFMALFLFWLAPDLLGRRPGVATPEFWFAMQIAMLAGFITSYPVNAILIRAGIKERM